MNVFNATKLCLKTVIFILCIFVIVQSLSCVQLFVTPWTAAHQTSLSLTISQSLPKFISIESVYFTIIKIIAIF